MKNLYFEKLKKALVFLFLFLFLSLVTIWFADMLIIKDKVTEFRDFQPIKSFIGIMALLIMSGFGYYSRSLDTDKRLAIIESFKKNEYSLIENLKKLAYSSEYLCEIYAFASLLIPFILPILLICFSGINYQKMFSNFFVIVLFYILFVLIYAIIDFIIYGLVEFIWVYSFKNISEKAKI